MLNTSICMTYAAFSYDVRGFLLPSTQPGFLWLQGFWPCLIVKFQSSYEEPSFTSKPCGHHHFWLQSMPFPTANMSIPYILKILKNTSAAGQCLLEAFDIIWNQLRCTESNLSHLTQIEQSLQ